MGEVAAKGLVRGVGAGGERKTPVQGQRRQVVVTPSLLVGREQRILRVRDETAAAGLVERRLQTLGIGLHDP